MWLRGGSLRRVPSRLAGGSAPWVCWCPGGRGRPMGVLRGSAPCRALLRWPLRCRPRGVSVLSHCALGVRAERARAAVRCPARLATLSG